MTRNRSSARHAEIGTYELSVEPHDDCCSYLLPKRVETRANLPNGFSRSRGGHR